MQTEQVLFSLLQLVKKHLLPVLKEEMIGVGAPKLYCTLTKMLLNQLPAKV